MFYFYDYFDYFNDAGVLLKVYLVLASYKHILILLYLDALLMVVYSKTISGA